MGRLLITIGSLLFARHLSSSLAAASPTLQAVSGSPVTHSFFPQCGEGPYKAEIVRVQAQSFARDTRRSSTDSMMMALWIQSGFPLLLISFLGMIETGRLDITKDYKQRIFKINFLPCFVLWVMVSYQMHCV